METKKINIKKVSGIIIYNDLTTDQLKYMFAIANRIYTEETCPKYREHPESLAFWFWKDKWMWSSKKHDLFVKNILYYRSDRDVYIKACSNFIEADYNIVLQFLSNVLLEKLKTKDLSRK